MKEQLKVVIGAEINDLKKGMQEGKKEVEDFGKQSKSSLDDFQESLNAAGDLAGTAATAITTAFAAAGAALLALGASTEEYRVNQAKLNSAFETAGASADTAKQVYNDLYRVLGEDDTAVEAANHLAKMTTSQQALSEWTNICQGVYATFGDSLPIEGLTEAANETAKVGTVTGSLADALNWAGVSEDEFNAKLAACNTEAEREQLIRQTLTGLYSEAAASYEESAASVLAQHEAEAKLAEASARLGEAIQPILTLLTELGAEIMESLAPAIEEFANEHGENLKSVLTTIADILGSVISFIVENIEVIAPLAGIVIAISSAIALVNAALTIYTTVQMMANTAMLTAVAVIAAIIIAIGLLVVFWDEIKAGVQAAGEAIKTAWGNMGEWFSGIADKIKNAFADFGNWIGNIFSAGWRNVQAAWSSAGSWFSGIWSKIQSAFSSTGSWFSNIFNNAVNSIKNAFNAIPNFLSNIWNKIKNIFKDVGSAISQGLTDAVKGAVNRILKKASDVINAAIAGINGAIEFINMIPGVNIGRISEMSVPQLAEGGVINRATLAVVGERGAEAVMPLENNLGWLDKLASMLNDRMGGNAPIVMQVDGTTFAQISVKSINQLTKQTGNLPLVLA